jgi:hypothetical protein
MAEVIVITSGSDAKIQFAFTDGATLPAVLAITSPTIIEAVGGLEGRCTIALTDGPNGLCEVSIEGTSPIVVGVYWLRIQVTLSDSSSLASLRVLIDVR